MKIPCRAQNQCSVKSGRASGVKTLHVPDLCIFNRPVIMTRSCVHCLPEENGRARVQERSGVQRRHPTDVLELLQVQSART